jgi:hypothetical protein
MDPALTEVFARLDRSRAVLRTVVETVPPHFRDQRPAPDRWSVAGVLEHLSLVDERFTGILAQRIAEARASGPQAEQTPAPLLPENVHTMLADRTERRNAPEPLHPRGLDCSAAWDKAEAARAAFRATLAGADGLALSRVLHDHPRFGSLNACQWCEFIAAHERRHTDQIREIATQLGEAM